MSLHSRRRRSINSASSVNQCARVRTLIKKAREEQMGMLDWKEYLKRLLERISEQKRILRSIVAGAGRLRRCDRRQTATKAGGGLRRRALSQRANSQLKP